MSAVIQNGGRSERSDFTPFYTAIDIPPQHSWSHSPTHKQLGLMPQRIIVSDGIQFNHRTPWRIVDINLSLAYLAKEPKETKMATRNVVLTDHQDSLVVALVASGRFQNASEAMRADLRLLKREEAEVSELSMRLANGVRQARDREFAEGTGAKAIRRAFAKARNR